MFILFYFILKSQGTEVSCKTLIFFSFIYGVQPANGTRAIETTVCCTQYNELSGFQGLIFMILSQESSEDLILIMFLPLFGHL